MSDEDPVPKIEIKEDYMTVTEHLLEWQKAVANNIKEMAGQVITLEDVIDKHT